MTEMTPAAASTRNVRDNVISGVVTGMLVGALQWFLVVAAMQGDIRELRNQVTEMRSDIRKLYQDLYSPHSTPRIPLGWHVGVGDAPPLPPWPPEILRAMMDKRRIAL